MNWNSLLYGYNTCLNILLLPFLFKVKKLAPHVVDAAKILFKDPDNEVNIYLVDCAYNVLQQRMKFCYYNTMFKIYIKCTVYTYVRMYKCISSCIAWIGCQGTLRTDQRGLSKWSLKVTETSGWCSGSCRVCCCFR